VADGIARVTLNRPDAGNAVDLAMARALVAASIRCQTDAEIRCVVLTGAGAEQSACFGLRVTGST
jgi:2-(1,2-epoxy-1,2-dihydrophenyl)acetyl-CoA isomerase